MKIQIGQLLRRTGAPCRTLSRRDRPAPLRGGGAVSRASGGAEESAEKLNAGLAPFVPYLRNFHQRHRTLAPWIPSLPQTAATS